MAVGKGSMARASKAAAQTASQEAAAKKAAPRGKAKAAVSGVIGAVSRQTMDKIVYQKSTQILDRDAMPGETFGIGDAMPVYFF